MPKTRIKNPNADRPEVVAEIKAMLADTEGMHDPLGYLMQFFTTVDLIGIRDQLRASPPAPKEPPARAVVVKPLEWVNCAALNGGRKLVAHDPFGHEVGRIDLRGMLEDDPKVLAYKAETQARYERTFRAALVEPAPALRTHAGGMGG